jgi:hypothetical protein
VHTHTHHDTDLNDGSRGVGDDLSGGWQSHWQRLRCAGLQHIDVTSGQAEGQHVDAVDTHSTHVAYTHHTYSICVHTHTATDCKQDRIRMSCTYLRLHCQEGLLVLLLKELHVLLECRTLLGHLLTESRDVLQHGGSWDTLGRPCRSCWRRW